MSARSTVTLRRGMPRRGTRGGTTVLGGLAVAGIAVLGGAFAVHSVQTAVALALLVLLVAVHSESRRAGMVLLWAYWLAVPAVRRALDLVVDAPAADPLSLLPVVGTGALALLEMRRARLSAAAGRTLGVAAFGFLLGVPAGLVADPLAFGFGAAAYGAGLAAFVLGWADARQGDGDLTLRRTLAVAILPIAAYGIAQYFTPLTAWDANWVETVDLSSIGAPQEGHIRIFSTLNSPGTLAAVLALAIVFTLPERGRPLLRAAVFAVGLLALALTFVRSIWLALVIGLLVYAAAARGRAAGKVVGIVAVVLVLVIGVGGSHPTTRAFTERVTSLGDLEGDVSAQERIQFTNELLPTAAQQPLGAGIGQAGLAVELEESSDSESLTSVDNGYLAVLYQVGPPGFVLVLIAMGASTVAAVRAARRPGGARTRRCAILAAFVMLLVAEASGDMLFGITGAVFWYLAGAAFASTAPDATQVGEQGGRNPA
jgi:putative inorganic carbon (HCO3(-)) transporter